MRRTFLVLLLLVAVITGAAYYYFKLQRKQNDELILYGNVDVRQVNLGFRVAGRVEKMFFEEGDFVETGALLGILDKQPYLDEVQQAQANFDSAKATLANAVIILNRRHELIQDGSVSQEDLDNALSNKIVFKANLKSSEAALAIAKTNLSFIEVFAPTSGTILTRIREPGTVVRESDPIYTLSVTSPVWVRAFVPEPLLGRVFPNQRAEIHTDTKGGRVYTGHIGFISPVAEFTPKTVETTQLRTDLVYRLRIYADNPDKGLRQGMPVTIKLIEESLKSSE